MPVKETIFAWDMGHSHRRMEVYPEYKNNRKHEFTPEDKSWIEEFYKQANVLHDNLSYFGVKSFRKKGWEGDDLVMGIADEIARRQPEDFSLIVSTDEDYHQLISSNIQVFSPIKKILFTLDNYKQLTGIEQENFLTYKILKGDSSDGIPGISGIGEVTAKSLVNKYGDIEHILDASEELMKSKRTATIFTPDGMATLDRNNKLINLRDYVDLSEVQDEIQELLDDEPVIDEKAVRAFLMRWQLTSLLVKSKKWMATFSDAVSNFYD